MKAASIPCERYLNGVAQPSWAPKGQTPIIQFHFNWNHVSVIAGLTRTNCLFRLHEGSIKKFEVHECPRTLAARVIWPCATSTSSIGGHVRWSTRSRISARRRERTGGVDGLIFFQDEVAGHRKIVVSLKKGGENVNVTMIRDLAHVVQRERAEIGLFVTLAKPTKPMTKEALKEGYYTSLNRPGFHGGCLV